MRYFVDVMTGVPSIVFGLFIYIVLVVSHAGGSGFAGWKGALALSLLMLPIVIRSAEVVLLLVPSSLREAALALGAPRWRIVLRVVLPTARTGLVTGSLLAVARGMGETAPLLFTVSAAFVATGNLNSQMNTLPVQIYDDITNPRNVVVARAWGAALTLVALVLILNVIARLISRRSAWHDPPETTSKEPTANVDRRRTVGAGRRRPGSLRAGRASQGPRRQGQGTCTPTTARSTPSRASTSTSPPTR